MNDATARQASAAKRARAATAKSSASRRGHVGTGLGGEPVALATKATVAEVKTPGAEKGAGRSGAEASDDSAVPSRVVITGSSGPGGAHDSAPNRGDPGNQREGEESRTNDRDGGADDVATNGDSANGAASTSAASNDPARRAALSGRALRAAVSSASSSSSDLSSSVSAASFAPETAIPHPSYLPLGRGCPLFARKFPNETVSAVLATVVPCHSRANILHVGDCLDDQGEPVAAWWRPLGRCLRNVRAVVLLGAPLAGLAIGLGAAWGAAAERRKARAL